MESDSWPEADSGVVARMLYELAQVEPARRLDTLAMVVKVFVEHPDFFLGFDSRRGR
jgi:hypothetical protein